MKIDPDRLRELRKRKRWTRKRLSNLADIHARTIQRLENEPEQCQKSREDTLNRLADALDVEPGVLIGELPLPESDNAPASDPDPVQIGAQIAPKVRLAYDLVKRRYGVSATEIINMAPLFFALLAEGSLARRREKLEEKRQKIDDLRLIEEMAHTRFGILEDLSDEAETMERYSINKVDLFGDCLFEDWGYTINILVDQPFDPSEDNPFASYLRKLKDELAIPGVVNVEGGGLRFGSPLKFPGYDICSDELNRITNGFSDARGTLETGYTRLSEIPEELMAEEAGEKRAKWLEDRLPDIYKGRNELVGIIGTSEKGEEIKKHLDEAVSRKTNSETEKGGDDQ